MLGLRARRIRRGRRVGHSGPRGVQGRQGCLVAWCVVLAQAEGRLSCSAHAPSGRGGRRGQRGGGNRCGEGPQAAHIGGAQPELVGAARRQPLGAATAARALVQQRPRHRRRRAAASPSASARGASPSASARGAASSARRAALAARGAARRRALALAARGRRLNAVVQHGRAVIALGRRPGQRDAAAAGGLGGQAGWRRGRRVAGHGSHHLAPGAGPHLRVRAQAQRVGRVGLEAADLGCWKKRRAGA
jgi:hypothetical protein